MTSKADLGLLGGGRPHIYVPAFRIHALLPTLRLPRDGRPQTLRFRLTVFLHAETSHRCSRTDRCLPRRMQVALGFCLMISALPLHFIANAPEQMGQPRLLLLGSRISDQTVFGPSGSPCRAPGRTRHSNLNFQRQLTNLSDLLSLF